MINVTRTRGSGWWWSNSTCISGPNQEGCEEIEISSGDGADCDQSTYGCCPDGVTIATGPNDEGCDGDGVYEIPDTNTGGTDTDVYYTETREKEPRVDVAGEWVTNKFRLIPKFYVPVFKFCVKLCKCYVEKKKK